MTNIHSTVILIDIFLYLELGVVPSERLFFNENERNYQKKVLKRRQYMCRTNYWNDY